MLRLIPLFLALAFASCQPSSESKQKGNQPTGVQYRANVSLLASAVEPSNDANRLPDFSWYDETGTLKSFSEVSRGRAVLINVWATWCGPCVRETPDLVELHNELSDRGALFIGISADLGDDAMALVTDFTKKFNVPYQMVVDHNGELLQAIGGIGGYPTTLYVDKNGNVTKKLLGMQSKQTFAKIFETIL